MPRHHVVNDQIIPFTAEEEATRDAEEAAHAQKVADELAAKPMSDWLAEMQASDQHMTRIEEDIIDALDAVTKQRLNQEVMFKYEAKKALRGRKP